MSHPWRVLATTAHLLVAAVLGPTLLITILTLVLIGIPLVPIAGTGLIPLAVAALLLRALVWFERERVSGLFGIEVPRATSRRSQRTSWLRRPHTLMLQLTDRSALRTLAHVGIVSLLGALTWMMAHMLGAGAALLGSAIRRSQENYLAPTFPLTLSRPEALAAGVACLVVAAAAVYALTLAHRAVTTQLLRGDREAELVREAASATRRRDEAYRAAEVERTRIERDLHDGVQPRLVSVGMTLGMARAKLAADPEAAASLIDEAHASTKSAITELRQLARGIHPAVLEDRGLDAALSALAARSHIPVLLDVRLEGRCGRETETALYFAIAEALTNATKYSQATRCMVTVTSRPGAMVWARIEDDGIGGAASVPGGGIDGLSNRIQAAGGSMTLTSPVGGPTTIEVSVPCES